MPIQFKTGKTFTVIEPKDLSHLDDEGIHEEFSGFRDDVLSDFEGPATVTAAPPMPSGPLVFSADKGLYETIDPAAWSKSETTQSECIRSASLSSTQPKLVWQINVLDHAFVTPFQWTLPEKTSKIQNALKNPTLAFFKKALRTAVIVAARIFVDFDCMVVPGIVDDSVSCSPAVMPSFESATERSYMGSLPSMKTSTKPLCEMGLLAPSDGLRTMTRTVHVVSLRVSHPDLSDTCSLEKRCLAIAQAVGGSLVEMQSQSLVSRIGQFFHEYMSQLELQKETPAAQPPVIDVQSIVQAATEAARQVALTTATTIASESGPMRRKQKNTVKPSAIKLGFNLRGARTKQQSEPREGRIMFLRILRKNILCRRFGHPQSSSHGGARSGVEQDEIRKKGFEVEWEEAKLFGFSQEQFVNFVATIDATYVPVAQKFLIKYSGPLVGFSEAIEAIQMDVGTSFQPTALDEELDGAQDTAYAETAFADTAYEETAYADTTADDQGEGGSGSVQPFAASPNTIEAVGHLTTMHETPEQRKIREDIEVGDLIMKSLSGHLNVEDIEKARIYAASPGSHQSYLKNIVDTYNADVDI